MINYSIIIPHKNTPKLLQRCLNSIPVRNDVQIIIVDDNSDPEIVDFKQFPGLNNPNTEVIFTKEGKGAGYARNTGLSKAVGKWTLFADSDDFYNYCINDIMDEYNLSINDIKDINAALTINSVKPYLGIGFGRAIPNRRVGVSFDLGALFHGTPTIKSDNAKVQELIDDNLDGIATDFLQKLKIYPVMSLKINFRVI